MPDPDEVRTALARLATGDVGATGDVRATGDAYASSAGDPFPGGPEATVVGRGSGDAPRTATPSGEPAGSPRETRAGSGDVPGPSRGALADRPLPPADAVTVVDVASEAVADLHAAAAFADAGGVPLLERAVAAADARDDVAVARRGQRALAAFRWVRRAARGGDGSDRGGFADADPVDAGTLDAADVRDAADRDADDTDREGDETDRDGDDIDRDADTSDADGIHVDSSYTASSHADDSDTDATATDDTVPTDGDDSDSTDTDTTEADDTGTTGEPTTSAPVTESI